MSTLTPSIQLEEIESKLNVLNIPPRFIRALLRNPEFQSLQYRNHQLCFLHKYASELNEFKLTYDQLAFIFGMCRITVSRSIANGPQNPKPLGRHMALEGDKEEIIVNQIIQMSNEGKSMTQRQILSFVKERFNLSLTKGWVNQFFLRNRDKIKKCRSLPQEDSRLLIPRAHLREHIHNMHKHVDGRLSELVFNLDEVGTSSWEDRKPKKVFVDANIRSTNVYNSVTRKATHMTLLTCISAAGDSPTPMLITKHRINDSFWDNGLRQDEDVMIRFRDPPYIDTNLFYEYINNVLIMYVKCVREKYGIEEHEAVLLMDSFSAHCNEMILKCLGENRIIALCFPSHTTNIFQALDLVLFGVFKKIKNSIDDGENSKIVEKAIIKILKAYELAATSFDIRGSFKRAGIISEMRSNLRYVKFVAENLVSNPGFQEIWNFNINDDEIHRKRSHNFGIINAEFLPPGCRLVSNETQKYENDDEIIELFK